MKYAVLFPGQGSQSVGMCPDVLEMRADLFTEARDVLGWDLATVISEGPDELLTSTDRAQPALYATSFALWEAFRSHAHGAPSAGAGHSLGEFTALTASGAMSFREGLSLVAERGLAMAEAASASPSGMAALIGADEEAAREVCAARVASGGRLYVANLNAPGQVVLAGGDDDLVWLEANSRELGIRRVIRLAVAGGFHSPFMAAAAERLDGALSRVEFSIGGFDVYANATAAPATEPRVSLREQLTSPVRFSETLEAMAASGIDTFVHIGPGDVTAGLARRTVPGATVHVVASIDDARDAGERLSVQ
jgi:[acyl-carrier-protein] S-malonyltransferase